MLTPEGNSAADAAAADFRLGPGASLRQVSDNEIVYPANVSTALQDTVAALTRLGRVVKTDEKKQFIEGRVRYGISSVRLRVSMVERDSSHTGIIIQGSSNDIWNAGGRSATNRLIETLTHLRTPGYRVDRLGMHPAALAGILCTVVVIVFFMVSILTRQMAQIFSR